MNSERVVRFLVKFQNKRNPSNPEREKPQKWTHAYTNDLHVITRRRSRVHRIQIVVVVVVTRRRFYSSRRDVFNDGRECRCRRCDDECECEWWSRRREGFGVFTRGED